MNPWLNNDVSNSWPSLHLSTIIIMIKWTISKQRETYDKWHCISNLCGLKKFLSTHLPQITPVLCMNGQNWCISLQSENCRCRKVIIFNIPTILFLIMSNYYKDRFAYLIKLLHMCINIYFLISYYITQEIYREGQGSIIYPINTLFYWIELNDERAANVTKTKLSNRAFIIVTKQKNENQPATIRITVRRRPTALHKLESLKSFIAHAVASDSNYLLLFKIYIYLITIRKRKVKLL